MPMPSNQLFVCPNCSVPIDPATGKCAGGGGCAHCIEGFRRASGVFDFVKSKAVEDEQAFYNDVYRQGQAAKPAQRPEEFAAGWSGRWSRQDPLTLQEVGDLEGKTIAIIGNGTSEKELFLLTRQPAVYVYSDLSPIAAETMQSRVDMSGTTSDAYFCAIDAHHLPFAENSIDVLYGYATVHHFPRLPEFFAGVVRVLKPGGRAVFMDDAYAPFWHFAKSTFAKPLMHHSHRRTGISPEDVRFSLSGGFREEELEKQVSAAGGRLWAKRVSFVNYLWHRATIKLLPASLQNVVANAFMDKVTAGIDSMLLYLPFGRRNQIRIVWGLTKP